MNAQINSVYAELGIAIPRHCIQQSGTAHLLLLTLEFTCLLSSEQDVLKALMLLLTLCYSIQSGDLQLCIAAPGGI